jgi:hypothetical protein
MQLSNGRIRSLFIRGRVGSGGDSPLKIGGDVEIITDPKPFATADDIIRRFRASGAIEMVVVAPLSVIGVICDRGLRPLWAEMEVVSKKDAEVVASGRGYKFIRFRRVKRLVLEFEEI